MSYKTFFETIGLGEWCKNDQAEEAPLSMQDLVAKANNTNNDGWWNMDFPSLDALNKACASIYKTRDVTSGVEASFLEIKQYLKIILDPITQPLSWLIDGALYTFLALPWWIFIPLLVIATKYICQSTKLAVFTAIAFSSFAFIDHYNQAVETLAIILVCSFMCVLLGVPIGIGMSKNNKMQQIITPILDMLQTLPSFVYLIPLIFLFSVTESKLYGIAIILYAIAPVIRLTDLGIRLVDEKIIEAANAFGMTQKQKLLQVEVPLALPNIMAGVNQTIMMSLSMVVIASLVSAPGLGVLVLRGIRNLELGVGLIAGLGIVLLAILLDRISKTTLARINVTYDSTQQ